MVGGKPKALAKYQDAEEKKEAEAAQLQLACAETPLSLDITTLPEGLCVPPGQGSAAAAPCEQ